MFSLICPHCKQGVVVLINKYDKELQNGGHAKLTCNNCKNSFIAKMVDGKVKLSKEEEK